MKIFIACGIAGAIAATFNAPITGVLFVEEVTLLRNIKIRSFLPVVISAATATVVAGFYSGESNIFYTIDILLLSYNELLIYALMGLVIGLMSSLFTKMHFYIENKFEDIFPETRIRPIVGGLLLGLIAFIPFGIGLEILGNGYSAIQKALSSEYTLWIAFGILII